MDKWEYITVELEQTLVKGGFIQKAVHDTNAYTKQLNEYGQQGWKLVSTFYASPISVRGTYGTQSIFAIFERKIQA